MRAAAVVGYSGFALALYMQTGDAVLSIIVFAASMVLISLC